jgi:pyrroline-5-carboxylate reductase
MSKQITIIGGGNLGTAIAEGLISSGFAKSSSVTITRRNTTLLQSFIDKGVTVTNDNIQSVKNAKYCNKYSLH